MSLGSITVKLSMDTATFDTDAGRAAKIADKRAKEIEASFKRAGTAIGVGLGFAVAGLGLYLKNTIESEKVSAKLDAKIKALGGSAAVSADEVKKLADSLQAASTFDDEAITEASTALLAFTNIGAPEFARTLSASLDLAAASGDDLTTTAEKLGKALNQPELAAKALRDTGIALTESQKKLIKELTETGRVGEAQGILLDELEKRYKGTAAAARDTLGGALESLKNAFNNLMEGDSGTDGLRGATEAVNNLSDSMNDPAVKRGVDNIVGGIGSIVAECLGGIGALQRFGENVNAIFDISSKVASGAPLSDFSDRELQIRTANLSTQKSNAKADGNTAEVARLQKLITEAIREGTRRNIATMFEGVSASVDSTYNATKAAAATGGGGGGNRTRGATPKKQADDATQAFLKAADAQFKWHERILDMQATLDGPTAEVMRDFQKQMGELDGEFAAGNVTLADYAKAQDLVTKKRDKDLEVINAQLTPFQEVNAAIAEQMELLGMSADAQEVWNNLKYAGVLADSELGKQIAESTKVLQDQRDAMSDQIEAMDAVRDAGKGLFRDLVDGSKSWKDAFTDALDSIQDRILDMIAENLMDQLFGKQGDPGGGASGDWLGSLFGAFFGGGKASGGTARANTMYEVNERGFEMATVGGRDYMLTGSQPVQITPNHKLGGGRGIANYNTFHLGAPTDPRSQDQIAQKIAQTQRMAVMRNS